MSRHKRIQQIQDLIIEIASGNFDAQGKITEKHDDFDAITVGINMLGEEIKHSTVSRDYLNSIYKGIVDMVIILNTDYTIQSVNSVVEKNTGFTSKELEKKPFRDLLYGSSKSLVGIDKQLKKKGNYVSVQKVFKTKDKKNISASCSGSILFGPNKKPTGILCIARDISKIKRTEQALVSKNKEMDQFIYKASHDLKGPLVSMIGLSKLAKFEVKDPVALKYFEMMNETAQKLNKTLVTLLNIAISEKVLTEQTEINFNELVEKAVASIGLELNEKISCRISNKTKKPHFSNITLLRSIVRNLLDNSVKYKLPATTACIKVVIEDVDEGFSITVKDNGVGIARQIQDKVYDMFFRGTNKPAGSGLGLYIVKKNLEKLNGQIYLSSQEGRGCLFKLIIPG